MHGHDTSCAFVTGASGFVGSHLVRKLAADGTTIRTLVRATSRRAQRLKDLPVDVTVGDLDDTQAVRNAARGARWIYHVGAAVKGTDETIRRSNIEGTNNIIEAAIANNVERLVFVSDIEVYDLFAAADGVVTEDTPLRTDRHMSNYTRSKLLNEQAIRDAHSQHGLPTVIVRPGLVIGPNGPLFFPHLGYRLRGSTFIVVRRGRNTLPLIYVDNMVEAMQCAARENAAIGNVYNLVDDPDATVREYLERYIGVGMGKGRIVRAPYVGPYLAVAAYELASGIGLAKKGRTCRSQFHRKHARVRFDNARARRDLNWSSSVPLHQGLELTFQWHREQMRETAA
jgi:nucleoside-diphosphate-sugar epimerase